MTLRERTETAVGSLSLLSDDVRRDIYFHVRDSSEPLTRDEVAELSGISRNLAAFHLEKLVAAQLLAVSGPDRTLLRRPGRLPKRYSAEDISIELSLPPRRYETLALVLIDAVKIGGAAVRDAAFSAARQLGGRIAADHLGGSRTGRLGAERALTLVRPVLEENGYEPEVSRESGEILLRNCPFHGVLESDRLLVCTLNQQMLCGVLKGLGADVLEARLEPRPDHCCVTIAPRS